MSKRRRRDVLPPKGTAVTVSRPSPVHPLKAQPAAPQPSPPERTTSRELAGRLWRQVTGPLAAPLSVCIGSRLAVFALAFYFVGLFPIAPDKKPDLVGALTAWDGGWYVRLATEGYSWRGPTVQSTVAFWPLFPLLGRLVGWVVGSVPWGLIIVANVSFAVYLIYLYKLGCLDLDQGSGYRAVLYVAIFPLSFVFSCAYTESTMLALTVAAFYYARKGNWWAAIPLGMLTTLTRLAGVVILLPLVWEFYKQKGLTWRALVLLIVPLGTLGYGLYLWRLTGEPLSIVTVTGIAWGRHFTWPWDTVRIGLDVLARNPRVNYVVSIAIVDVVTIISFILLSIACVRWMRPSYWLYAFPATFLAISSTLDPKVGLPTASLARYLLAVFPAFMLLGRAGKNPYVHHLFVFMFAILLGALSIYFFSVIWVV